MVYPYKNKINGGVLSVDEGLAKLLIQFIHPSHNVIDQVGGMEQGNGHILLVTSAEHSGMLQHGILLETTWCAAIEETKHIGYGYSTIENIATDKDICTVIQTQLAILAQ